jgi:hypothetical protein
MRNQLHALAPHKYIGFKGTAGVYTKAAATYAIAPQVVVHPFNPYAKQAAGRIRLRQRKLSAFKNNRAPFILNVSLVLRGKVLEGINVYMLFSDSVIKEQGVRRLVAILGAVVRAMVEASDDVSVDEILAAAGC